MRRLAFLVCIIPYLSFAQMFEISDVCGYGGLAVPINNPYQYGTIKSGFSNLFSVDYNIDNTFSVGANYLLNNWNVTGNCLGIAGNWHYYNIYCGLDISAMMFGKYRSNEKNMPEITYKPALSSGIHIGAYSKVYKCLYVKEQIGMNYSLLSFSYNTLLNSGKYINAEYNEKCTLIYILVGITCILDDKN